MITLYTWKTPNGRKPAIMLEETGLPYKAEGVDLSKKEQFSAAFQAISPNNKIPAIVDDDPVGGGRQALFESGAILTYLAEKSGLLLASSGPARYAALEWLHWQVGGIGPIFGQLGFFALRSQEKAPLAVTRFTEEAERLIGVLDRRLTEAAYLGGDDYSIADIATYPWVAAAKQMMSQVLDPVFAKAPATLAWLDRVGARPAVSRGMAVLEEGHSVP